MATAGVKIMPLGLGMRLLWIFTSTWKWKVSSELFAFPGFISVVVFFFNPERNYPNYLGCSCYLSFHFLLSLLI